MQVNGPDAVYYRTRTDPGVEGVDVGVKTVATLSTREQITGPKAHRRAVRRWKIRQRAIPRKRQAAKTPIGLAPQDPLPQGTRLPRRRNGDKAPNHVARTQLRQDFLPKTSTRLCRENQAVGIETLSVKGMMATHRLARSIADQGFGEFFALLQYQAPRYGTQLIEADRWFPSSKLCSTPGCGYVKKDLTLKDRTWTCPGCGVTPERDVNAAITLQGLATPTALPVATRPVRTAPGSGQPDIGGKVTPVRHEATPESLLSASGQEEFGDHHRSPNL